MGWAWAADAWDPRRVRTQVTHGTLNVKPALPTYVSNTVHDWLVSWFFCI
jgi:hypothetical protein